jgi:DUF1009 family protein
MQVSQESGVRSQKIGIIAGNGRFPIIFAENAKGMGLEVIAVAHRGETISGLEGLADKTFWIKVGELGKLIKIFKNEGITDVVMAGGIKKTRLFADIVPDLRTLMILGRLKNNNDDGILRAVASELEKEGIIVRESTLYLTSLLAQEGLMTKRRPTKGEMEDIEFGWEIAKEIGRYEIGQCIVVKKKTVLAVEAVDGTDETIRRGGRLGKEGALVIKTCKPHQDLRFDIPAIGPDTISAMGEVSATVLAIEAGKTVLLDKEEVIRMANESNISIIGVKT